MELAERRPPSAGKPSVQLEHVRHRTRVRYSATWLRRFRNMLNQTTHPRPCMESETFWTTASFPSAAQRFHLLPSRYDHEGGFQNAAEIARGVVGSGWGGGGLRDARLKCQDVATRRRAEHSGQLPHRGFTKQNEPLPCRISRGRTRSFAGFGPRPGASPPTPRRGNAIHTLWPSVREIPFVGDQFC